VQALGCQTRHSFCHVIYFKTCGTLRLRVHWKLAKKGMPDVLALFQARMLAVKFLRFSRGFLRRMPPCV